MHQPILYPLLMSPGGGKGKDCQELADSHPLFPAQPPLIGFPWKCVFAQHSLLSKKERTGPSAAGQRGLLL